MFRKVLEESFSRLFLVHWMSCVELKDRETQRLELGN